MNAIYKRQLYSYKGERGVEAILEDEAGQIFVMFGDEQLVVDPTDDEYFAAKEFTDGLDRCANCHVVLDVLDDKGFPVKHSEEDVPAELGVESTKWEGNLCSCREDSCDDCYVKYHAKHNQL